MLMLVLVLVLVVVVVEEDANDDDVDDEEEEDNGVYGYYSNGLSSMKITNISTTRSEWLNFPGVS